MEISEGIRDLVVAQTQGGVIPTENGEAAVGGTPTFFINGRRLVGAYPLSYFKQIIDADLATRN